MATASPRGAAIPSISVRPPSTVFEQHAPTAARVGDSNGSDGLGGDSVGSDIGIDIGVDSTDDHRTNDNHDDEQHDNDTTTAASNSENKSNCGLTRGNAPRRTKQQHQQKQQQHQQQQQQQQQLLHPQHPLSCMQGPLEESMMDSRKPPSDSRTRDTLDAAARRLQLLELDQLSDEYSSRWTQKSGARYHPLWKLIAQISFGVHLLHRNIAKSEPDVVAILQSHIKEVDAFLEDVTADFDLALKDIHERTLLLDLPLQHGDTFDAMLLDRAFRVAIVEGNDIIERIIDRTRKAMKSSLKDVSQGRDATAELAKYLERIGCDWTRGNGELLDIMAAMRGNAEGWSQAFGHVDAVGARLSTRLTRLEATVIEVAHRAGKASRRETALKEARRQHEKREQQRQLRACRSTPQLSSSRAAQSPTVSVHTVTSAVTTKHHHHQPALASPALASPALSSRSAASSRRHNHRSSARASHIDKPLPSVPSIKQLISAHERSLSQPFEPTQPPPFVPLAAATEPSTPDFEVPGSVGYFPVVDAKASRTPSSESLPRPSPTLKQLGAVAAAAAAAVPRRTMSRGYSDKEVLVSAPAPMPAFNRSTPPYYSPVAGDVTPNSHVRSPLTQQIIAEYPPQLSEIGSSSSSFTFKAHDVDDSVSGSCRVSSSRYSSDSDHKSPRDRNDSAYASVPETPNEVGLGLLDLDGPKSAMAAGPFPYLNGPSPGMHPLHCNRISTRLSIDLPLRRRRNLSQETTALPPCQPKSNLPDPDSLVKTKRTLAGKTSFASLKGLFTKKQQAMRPIGNGGLGGHSNYAI